MLTHRVHDQRAISSCIEFFENWYRVRGLEPLDILKDIKGETPTIAGYLTSHIDRSTINAAIVQYKQRLRSLITES